MMQTLNKERKYPEKGHILVWQVLESLCDIQYSHGDGCELLKKNFI